jgi:hypothetical protein
MSGLHISASVHIGDSTRVYTIIAIDGDQVWLRDAEGNHSTWEVGEVRPVGPPTMKTVGVARITAAGTFWGGPFGFKVARAKEGA